MTAYRAPCVLDPWWHTRNRAAVAGDLRDGNVAGIKFPIVGKPLAAPRSCLIKCVSDPGLQAGEDVQGLQQRGMVSEQILQARHLPEPSHKSTPPRGQDNAGLRQTAAG